MPQTQIGPNLRSSFGFLITVADFGLVRGKRVLFIQNLLGRIVAVDDTFAFRRKSSQICSVFFGTVTPCHFLTTSGSRSESLSGLLTAKSPLLLLFQILPAGYDRFPTEQLLFFRWLARIALGVIQLTVGIGSDVSYGCTSTLNTRVGRFVQIIYVVIRQLRPRLKYALVSCVYKFAGVDA